MAYDNRGPFIGGSLRANAFKTAPNHPDVKGDMTIDQALLNHLNALAKAGMPLRVDMAGWQKTDSSGKKYMSLKASADRRDETALAGGQAAHPTPARPDPRPRPEDTSGFDINDDIPF